MPLTAEMIERRSLNRITSILKITNTVGYYSGQYYCVAENQVGGFISRIVIFTYKVTIYVYSHIMHMHVIIHYR